MESPVAVDDYREALVLLHEALQPRTYLEIGVFSGASMMLAQTDTLCIGVDPEPMRGEHPLRRLPSTTIFAETSDAFFATRDLDDLLRGDPLDLAFIDGMHLFEYALRDFINIEANSHPGTVIAVHDCFPLDAVKSSRLRTTVAWTGDVWKLAACLHKYRPDLDVMLADVSPSGLCIVSGLDPQSTVLSGLYAGLLDEYVPLGWDHFETEMADEFSALTVPEDEAIDRVSRLRVTGWSSTLVKLRRLDVQLGEVRAELAVNARQLADVYASTSWRLTAPVRLAGRQVARLSGSACGSAGRE